MELESELQIIRDKGLKGVIIETGAGSPLYSELCDRPNTASKMVKYAFSPTDQSVTNKDYTTSQFRAVSYEVCGCILRDEIEKNNDISYVFCNSIQIGNEPEIQTHGWIGYAIKDIDNVWRKTYYHFSIDNFDSGQSRKDLITLIKKICLDIFCSLCVRSPLSGYIDIMLDSSFNYQLRPVLMQKMLSEEKFEDNYICINAKGQLVRFNDFLRNSLDNVILFKGSFNPIHPIHTLMVKEALTLLQSSSAFMMISIENWDPKKEINIDNILQRIAFLNDLGFNVIINKFGRFFNANLRFTQHPDFKNKKLYQLMGDDTLHRLINSESIFSLTKNFKNVCILTRCRNHAVITYNGLEIQYLDVSVGEMSSTNMRSMIENNSWEELEQKISDVEYLRLLKKHYVTHKYDGIN